MEDDRIPTSETYRDIPIHSGQRARRVATVKRAIDVVHDQSDLAVLFDILSDPPTPPEARAFAGRKILASFEGAASSRLTRPRGVDLRTVEGIVGTLSSNRWRSPTHYGTLLEPAAGQVQR